MALLVVSSGNRCKLCKLHILQKFPSASTRFRLKSLAENTPTDPFFKERPAPDPVGNAGTSKSQRNMEATGFQWTHVLPPKYCLGAESPKVTPHQPFPSRPRCHKSSVGDEQHQEPHKEWHTTESQERNSMPPGDLDGNKGPESLISWFSKRSMLPWFLMFLLFSFLFRRNGSVAHLPSLVKLA